MITMKYAQPRLQNYSEIRFPSRRRHIARDAVGRDGEWGHFHYGLLWHNGHFIVRKVKDKVSKFI